MNSVFTLPSGTHRRLPRGGNTHSEMIRLYTADECGDVLEGLIRIPLRLIHAKPDTNEKLEFDALIRKSLERWTGWKAKQGWVLNSVPKVRGPFDPATEMSGALSPDQDVRWYFASAKFKREYPLWLPMDGYDWLWDKSTTYDIDLRAPRMPVHPLDRGKAMISDSGPAHDPLKFAEARRQELGLKRQDYLIGPLWEPLDKNKAP